MPETQKVSSTPSTRRAPKAKEIKQEETKMSEQNAAPTPDTQSPVVPAPAKRGRKPKAETLTAAGEAKPKRAYNRKNPAKSSLTPNELLKLPVTEMVSEFETLTAEADRIAERLKQIRFDIAIAMDENEIPTLKVEAASGTLFEVSRKNKVRHNMDKEGLIKAFGEDVINKYIKKTPFTETRIEAVRRK